MKWNRHVVEFEDGQYAIRYGFIFYRYQDLKNNYTYNRNSGCFKDCLGDVDEIKKYLKNCNIVNKWKV